MLQLSQLALFFCLLLLLPQDFIPDQPFLQPALPFLLCFLLMVSQGHLERLLDSLPGRKNMLNWAQLLHLYQLCSIHLLLLPLTPFSFAAAGLLPCWLRL